MQREETELHPCPTEATLAVIGGRWKVPILWNLFVGTCRFGELSRKVGGATQKMLTQQLRELEADGLVHRKIYPEVPPRVEYSATALGRSLEPVVAALSEWGEKYLVGRPPRRRRDRKSTTV
ncbi:MAG TPA: helix-turn-helix domain-containing protein [Fibrobacteria bacterium]|nr:helix-turn-helix domain-containing protein [Fibrobacteria bacterium]